MHSPRKQKKNAFQLMILGCIFLMTYLGTIAAVYVCLGISVDIRTLTVALVLIDLFLGFRNIRQKCWPALKWTKEYWIGGAVLLIFLLLISWRSYEWPLSLNYSDVDAARYFQRAMDIYNKHSMSLNQYLTYLVLDVFIEIFAPFLPDIEYYKAMIWAHIFIQLMSMLMFYVVANEINKRRNYQWINIVVTILYWCGFPLCNSTYGTFIQSMNGATYVMLLVYFALRLQKNNIKLKEGLFGIFIGICGLIMCYPFYLPIVAVMLIPEICIWIKTHWKEIDKRMKTRGIVCLFIMIVFGFFFGFSRFNYSFQDMFSYMSGEGLTYREPYQDFLFFIPVFIVYGFLLLKWTNVCKTIFRMNVLAVGYTLIWFGLFIAGTISSYYYYRIYYILWMLLWWMSLDTINLMLAEKKHVEVIAYAALCACAILTSIFNTRVFLYGIRAEAYMEMPKSSALCPLYQFNANNIRRDRKSVLTEDEFELFDYVNAELGNQNVEAINSIYSSMQIQWYLGITNMGEGFHYSYDLNDYCLYVILAAADYAYNTNYILIEKSDPVCMQYYDLLFSKCNVAYENDAGYIFEKKSDEYWTAMAVAASDVPELFELGAYAMNELQGIKVPVVCEGEKWNDALYYSMFAGTETTLYANTVPNDFIATTYVYNNDEIDYLMVLKDSEVYRQNREYFDQQKLVYETAAGMIIQHEGDGWMPSEQE